MLALTSAECDITDPVAVERHVGAGDVVINCAAYTKVDERRTRRGQGVRRERHGRRERRAGLCPGRRSVDPRLHRLRVQRRFADGEPRPYEIDDETDPLSVYGRTKLAGEFDVLAAMPDAHVVRTSWIFGRRGTTSSRPSATRPRATTTSTSWRTRSGRPTYVGDLAQALLRSGRRRHLGARPARRQRRRRPAGTSRPGRCSRRSAPIRSGSGRSAPTGIRVPRPGPRTRRCPAAQVDGGGAHAAATVARRAGRSAAPAYSRTLTGARYPLRRERRTDRGDGDVLTGSAPRPLPVLAAHATDRPVTVVMADNGSTDGAPEEAVERYPNTRLLRTGANLGYGTAVNRARRRVPRRCRAPSSSSSPTPTCSGGRAASTHCWRLPSDGRRPARSAR